MNTIGLRAQVFILIETYILYEVDPRVDFVSPSYWCWRVLTGGQ